mmetsp:Transcript_751/g.1246  ORF Transcript_751/g.1246 Transcript_751/m.1246 type:complete len:329 (-) Transcript_751:138-1124(-)
MTSPRIAVQPAGRFLASRIISSSSTGSSAVRQTSSLSSTSSSSVVAAISSSLTSSSSSGGVLSSSPSVDYNQRRGFSSNNNAKGVSIDYSSRHKSASSLTSWMLQPSHNCVPSSMSTHQLLQNHRRQSFVTSTKYLQQEEQQPSDDDGDECPPWQNPLHHNNPDYTRVLAEEFAPGEEMPLAPLPPFEDEGDEDKVSAPPHLHDLADQIVRLNMLEVKELVDRIGDHFGFTDDEDDYMDAAGGGDGEGAAVEEAKVEKTVFDLKLTGFDAKAKIKVIKEIRGLTSLGLKEAKELVEGAPTTVKKDIKMEEAEEIKAKLEAVGATVEIV